MGKKFPLGEQKFQPKGIFSNTLRRGNNKGVLHPRLRAADAFCLFLTQKAQKKPDFKGKSDFI